MARKRLKLSYGGSAPWMNTFADLMNLLLCFFVMMFAFSDINAEKFEKVSISMANSIGIKQNVSDTDSTDSIDTGMSQIKGLDEYYNKLKKSDGDVSGQSPGNSEISDIDKALQTIDKEMEASTTEMYDKVSDLAKQYALTDYVELSMDPDHKYVELTMKGSVLYSSGEAEIKKESLPILRKIGDILKKFEGCSIEVTGYTDNVPMTDESEYKDNNWLSSARALNAAEYLIGECRIDPSILKYSGRGEYEPIASNATEEGRAENRRIEFRIFNEYNSE